MSQHRVEAVERALTLLECFNQQKRCLSLTELAEVTGMYKSTVLRLAASLERFHFLVRGQDGRYGVGQSLWRLGQLYHSKFNIEQNVRPELIQLMELTGETASLYVREGNLRVCLYRENSRRAARHHLDEGVSLPLASGASGHVLAAFSEPSEQNAKTVAEQGYAVSLGERDPDLAAVAVPLFSRSGILIGALTLSGIITRFTPENQAVMLQALKESATRLSQKITE
ncbi:IclR family transcriptional regulator [Paenalcaligenes sp. Me131]|uniref:IclR family transcriptional regulator n=1 Tax=Paenalcaligenes sp. Me131 TaxID=3392636 RepID=UPI003D2B17D8